MCVRNTRVGSVNTTYTCDDLIVRERERKKGREREREKESEGCPLG